MPGYLLTDGATVICNHGGTAGPAMASLRVTIDGQPAAMALPPWDVTGCANPSPPTQLGPCTTAMFTPVPTRVKVEGQYVLYPDSSSQCVPTGTPLVATKTQMRVKGL